MKCHLACACSVAWALIFGLGERSSGAESEGQNVRLKEFEQIALSQSGSVDAGRKLFQEHVALKCSTCHRVDGNGKEVGPDLSSIGGKFDRPHLIESLLEPSRQIVEGYSSSVLLMVDGTVRTGIVKQESEAVVTLAELDGKLSTINQADIEQRQESPVSLMPSGLIEQLTPEQFIDLVAYLESLRAGSKEKMGASVTGPLSVPPGFELSPVATGLDGATAMEILPDGRVLICEQTGAVRVVENGQLLQEPFVTLPVDAYWERGVIGVTCHPDFPVQPFVYVCWVAKEPYAHHRVSRFTADGNRAIPGSELVLLQGDDQATMGGKVPAGHQGGALHFGVDGKLYIGIGEQTAATPAQRLDTYLGKILRINSDGSIPADNPFLDQAEGKYQAIWARGCRNPFTFAVRPADGLLLINDVGGEFEEINVGRAGANYGWPTVEHGPQEGYTDSHYTPAIHWYPQSSINGGDFCPTDSDWPAEWRGKYFFADFVQAWIKAIDPAKPQVATSFASNIRRPVDLRFAPDGSLYVLVRNAWVVDDKFQSRSGSLLQIRQAPQPVGDPGEKQAHSPAMRFPDGQAPVSVGNVQLIENSHDDSANDLPAFEIRTPVATYFLEKRGGGLSSLLDREGNDWLGFDPRVGSKAAGEFRGFPNAVHQQLGSYFHPKNQATDPVRTTVEQVTNGYVSIVAQSESGHWGGRYEFFPTHCTFSMTSIPPDQKYWILYEGTPGGSFELDDWWFTSENQRRQPMETNHEGDIPAPEWIAFGDSKQRRALVLLNHKDDEHPDSFYQMQGDMTVFGFGRQRMQKYLTQTEHRFSIALIESDSHQDIERFVSEMSETVADPLR
jgi:putative heme-binding domain-containing protein